MEKKNDNDIVSIIIPVYRVEKYLDECIQSVLNQTYNKIEIILIDDGSDDNCPIMCDDYAKKDKRIKVIHQENLGLPSARNVGIRAAQGKFIAFCDSDDSLKNNMVEKMVEAIRKNNVDVEIIVGIVYCNRIIAFGTYVFGV